MWSIETPSSGITNRAVVPQDGIISVVKPEGVEVTAFINDMSMPVHHVHVKAGDTVHFELKSSTGAPASVSLEYAGNTDLLYIEPAKNVSKEENIMTGSEAINLFANPMRGDNMGGALGGGLGAGLVGGILGTALLGRNGLNNGGFIDGATGAGALAATLRNPPEQDMANMSLMAAIGGVDKAVAVSTAAMEASQANQSAGIVGQLNSVTASLATRIDGTKEAVNANAMVLSQQLNGVNTNIMTNRYELAKEVNNDGDKTRALITQQYEMNLQRQLADANAAIIELRGDNRLSERTRGIEVTTTNNINQMQQQQQQQAQYGQLANLIWGLQQSIRSTNEAINVGSGTLTANPANTNTNIR